MKFVKYGAVVIAIYLVVQSVNSGPILGSAGSGAANVIKSFQGR